MILQKLRNKLIVAVIFIIIASILTTVVIDISPRDENKVFPGIIGDMILKNNETGIFFIRNITLYDDFRGNITQGYKGTYSNNNGSMIIFLAQLRDNVSANRSLKDMVIRSGFNESTYNESIPARITRNITVAKLPVKNPEVFVMQKNINISLHYVFYKKDKVYWVGFDNDPDIQFQLGMLVEVYKKVDFIKGDFGSFSDI